MQISLIYELGYIALEESIKTCQPELLLLFSLHAHNPVVMVWHGIAVVSTSPSHGVAGLTGASEVWDRTKQTS